MSEPIPTCPVKCGGPMDGWWRCGEPAVDSSGRCSKHTFLHRRFTLDELRSLPVGLGVHVEFNGKVRQNFNLLCVDFDAGTAVVSPRTGHGKGAAKRAKLGLPTKAPVTRTTVPVSALLKPRSFSGRVFSDAVSLSDLFNRKK